MPGRGPGEGGGRHAALRPIVERVAALDGTMDVETTPGWGTTLPIEIPPDPPSAALTVEGAEELTDREKQVLRLVATGISNQRIGDQLESWWPAVKAMPHAVQDQPDAKPVNAQL